MLKLIITGIWVAVVTLGTVYASIQFSKPADPNAAAEAKKAVQEFVQGELVTLPVIKNGDVDGYFLTKASYIVDKTKVGEVTVPIPAVMTDELYTALVGDQLIRLGDNKKLDVEGLRKRIKTAMNKRLEADVIMDVIFEQIDYLSKDDLRQQKIGNAEKVVHEDAPADMPVAKAESSGH
jgi:hypothetical protein